MKKFLSAAKQKVDQAELYYYQSSLNHIEYQNGKINEIEGTIQCGYSLRVIKDNTLGFAYTKNLDNPELLLQGALNSLKAGTKTNMKFAANQSNLTLNTFEKEMEEFDAENAVRESERVIRILKDNTDRKVDTNLVCATHEISVINTSGTELTAKFSYYVFACGIILPHTAGGISYVFKDKKFSRVPDSDLQDLNEMYQKAQPEQRVKSGKMKVLFLPGSLYVLLWRLASGTAGNNICYKKSPLINKIGEKIFSEKLTIYDDPHNDRFPLARAFDDEGTKTGKLMIVEKGVLKNYYFDLFYADKMGIQSTGNGYKSMMWGGETAALKPTPSLEHLIIEPGNKSLREMISSMDMGIIVAGVLGAHSGNIINGDFSVGIEPCLVVENGEIIGRAKNTMIAGNIYEVMKNVTEVENRLHHVFIGGRALPAILFDNIMVVSG